MIYSDYDVCVVLVGGIGICYHTSGKYAAGIYTWESTSVPVTAAGDAYCSSSTAECITMDHGCDMKLNTIECDQHCYAICEKHP